MTWYCLLSFVVFYSSLTYSLECSSYRLIEKTISSAYQLVRQPQLDSSEGGSDFMETESDSTKRSFIDLPKELFEMLTIVGPYLHRDTLLLQKVNKLISYIFKIFKSPLCRFSQTVNICFFVVLRYAEC